MLGGVLYDKVDDEGLHITVDGTPKLLDVDNVVVCAGQEPLKDLEVTYYPPDLGLGKVKVVPLPSTCVHSTNNVAVSKRFLALVSLVRACLEQRSCSASKNEPFGCWADFVYQYAVLGRRCYLLHTVGGVSILLKAVACPLWWLDATAHRNAGSTRDRDSHSDAIRRI